MNDNGGDRNGPFRGRTGEAWEGGIRVPCMLRWPGVIRPGVFHEVGIGMDWLPTLLSACRISPPKERKFDGIDLLPALKGGKPVGRRHLFWRLRRLDRLHRAARHGDMKWVFANDDEGLYDLGRDEGEKNNLIASRPEVARDLKMKFAAWEKQVAAPRTADFRKTIAASPR
jgi:arylsulfatase A-like enzyme